MAPLLDMYPDPVHSSGRNVTGLSGDAGEAGRGFLRAVLNAHGAVVHSTVAGALEAYHGRWSQEANRMESDVAALGENVSGSAVEVSTGNADATADGATSAASNQNMAVRLNSGGVIAV